MRRFSLIIGLFFIITGLLSAGVTEQVQNIRDIYNQTNEEINSGELYKTVVDINADGLSYPAVGVYHPVLTFYFGFSEENPYPDNLRKAMLVVDRAAYHEYSEFLYDGYGELIFAYVTGNPMMPEMRFYYHNGDLIKIIEDSKSFTSFNSEQKNYSNTIFEQGENLNQIFSKLFF